MWRVFFRATHLQLATLFADHFAVLDDLNGTLVDGVVRLVPEPVLIALQKRERENKNVELQTAKKEGATRKPPPLPPKGLPYLFNGGYSDDKEKW